MVYGAALGALGLIMWRLSLDLLLTFALLGGGVVAALVLGGLLFGIGMTIALGVALVYRHYAIKAFERTGVPK